MAVWKNGFGCMHVMILELSMAASLLIFSTPNFIMHKSNTRLLKTFLCMVLIHRITILRKQMGFEETNGF